MQSRSPLQIIDSSTCITSRDGGSELTAVGYGDIAIWTVPRQVFRMSLTVSSDELLFATGTDWRDPGVAWNQSWLEKCRGSGRFT